MSAYTKAIKAASAKYEALLTRYRARFGDATMSSKEQRMLEQELSDAQRTVQRLMKQAEAEDVYGWGPDQQLDEMMQRYRREGIEQRYPEAKEIVDHPTGHIVVNPDGSAREVRSPGGFNQDYPSQQMDMFEEMNKRYPDKNWD